MRFDDALATRIYLNGRTGEFVTSRHEAWGWYDSFWRLHIMDYAQGEDFNGALLRAASITAFGLVLAGAILAALAVRRRWRVAHKPKRHWHARGGSFGRARLPDHDGSTPTTRPARCCLAEARAASRQPSRTASTTA